MKGLLQMKKKMAVYCFLTFKKRNKHLLALKSEYKYELKGPHSAWCVEASPQDTLRDTDLHWGHISESLNYISSMC